jgi:hypothetical protein
MFKGDSKAATALLKSEKQFKLKMDFAKYNAHMRSINKRIKSYDLKEADFQAAVIAGTDLRYKDKFSEAYDKALLDAKADVLASDDFYNLGIHCEKHAPAVFKPSLTSRPTPTPVVVASVQTSNSTNATVMPEHFRNGKLTLEARVWCRDNNACTFCRTVGHRIHGCKDPKLIPLEEYRARQVHFSHLSPRTKALTLFPKQVPKPRLRGKK